MNKALLKHLGNIDQLAGIVIKPVEHLALYVNYTAGLTDGGTAPVGVSNAFQTMSPFKSKQLEAGVKVDWGNMVTQAAVFQIAAIEVGDLQFTAR